MKKFIFIACLCALTFISCNRKNTIDAPTGSLTAIATIENKATKTDYTDNGTNNSSALKVDWSTEETFKAFYEGNNYVTFSKTDGNTFAANNIPAGVTQSTSFVAVYGEKATYNNGQVNIDFADQNGTLANLSKYDIMSCESTNENDVLAFAFKHQCAILRVELVTTDSRSTDQSHVKISFHNARLKGTTGELYNISVTSGSSTSGITTSANEVVLNMNFDGPIAGNNTGVRKTIYVVVPPMEWNNVNNSSVPGGAVRMYSKTVELNSTTRSIDAGKLYDVTATYTHEVWGTGVPD